MFSHWLGTTDFFVSYSGLARVINAGRQLASSLLFVQYLHVLSMYGHNMPIKTAATSPLQQSSF